MYDTARETLLSKWRKKNGSGADTMIAVTSAHPRPMENERRGRGNGNGFNSICCKTCSCCALYFTVHYIMHNYKTGICNLFFSDLILLYKWFSTWLPVLSSWEARWIIQFSMVTSVAQRQKFNSQSLIMFSGGNFRNLIHTCESGCRAAKGGGGKGGLREKKMQLPNIIKLLKRAPSWSFHRHAVHRTAPAAARQFPARQCHYRWQDYKCCWGTFEVLQNSLHLITCCVYFLFHKHFLINEYNQTNK